METAYASLAMELEGKDKRNASYHYFYDSRKHILKGSRLFLQVTALAWISVVSTAMQLCCGIIPVLYRMATWVMLSGIARSSAGWDQNVTNSLVIIIVLSKIFTRV
jgi:hypothetical protein